MPRGVKNVYDPKVVEYVKEHYLGVTSNELCEMIKCDLGIEETPLRIKQLRKKYSLRCGVDCTFHKGYKPKHQFQKGNIPHNILPIGSEKIHSGYVYVKVSEDRHVHQNNNWRPKQQIIWENHHKRQVPPGHLVIFADGNKRNFDIDNLVLVTSEEMMYLVSHDLIYNDCELTKTGLLIAKVSIAAKDRSKNK